MKHNCSEMPSRYNNSTQNDLHTAAQNIVAGAFRTLQINFFNQVIEKTKEKHTILVSDIKPKGREDYAILCVMIDNEWFIVEDNPFVDSFSNHTDSFESLTIKGISKEGEETLLEYLSDE